jgi:hypothetical protein
MLQELCCLLCFGFNVSFWRIILGGDLVSVLGFGPLSSRLTLIFGAKMANVTLDAFHTRFFAVAF